MRETFISLFPIARAQACSDLYVPVRCVFRQKLPHQCWLFTPSSPTHRSPTPGLSLFLPLSIDMDVYQLAQSIVKVSKKSFQDVVFLLEKSQRPIRLTFVRHLCGRRFRTRRECRDDSSVSWRSEAPWSSVFGSWGLGRRRGIRPPSPCEKRRRNNYIGKSSKARAAPVAPASSPSPQKSRKNCHIVEVTKKVFRRLLNLAVDIVHSIQSTHNHKERLSLNFVQSIMISGGEMVDQLTVERTSVGAIRDS